MQPRSIFKALVRLAVAASLMAVMAPMSRHEAEAGRLVKRHGSKAGAAITGNSATAGATERRVEDSAGAESEAGEGALHRADNGAPQSPLRASVARVLPAAPVVDNDEDVPGCAPGKLCTVCVAGCNSDTHAIVHSVPKGLRAE
jgi:hypothetical protein